jgi:hypothetical protein
MRTEPAELTTWFWSSVAPPNRFLAVGLVYCAVGLTSVIAARVLGHNLSRGLMLASVAIVFAAVDVLFDVLRKRITGFDWTDGVATALTCALLLLAAAGLIQSRRMAG